MKSLIIYIIEVNIYVLLFYLFFQLFLKKETFSRANRFYLLGSWVVSFILPFLYIPGLSVWNFTFLSNKIQGTYIDPAGLTDLDKISLANSSETGTMANSDNILFAIVILVLMIAILILLRNLINYFKIVRIVKNHGIEYYKGYKIVYTDNNLPIFSFLTYIFWNRKFDISQTEGRAIFNHEKVHVQELHSLDLIFFELLTILFFYNPILYLYKKSIRLIHEYIADNNIMSKKELGENEYCNQLFNMTFNLNTNPLINNFYKKSNLKNRLKMINKKKSGIRSAVKFILLIPTLLVILTISSCIKDNEQKMPVPENKSETQPVFYIVEDMPTFMEGDSVNSLAVFRNYIGTKLNYPAIAMENGIEGTVHVKFIVDENGEIIDPKVLRSVDPVLDAEALRVFEDAPKWTPGKQRGKNVKVEMAIPIKFVLQDGDGSKKPVDQETDSDIDIDVDTDTEQQVFYVVEDMPEFQDYGKRSLNKFRDYISQNLQYPTEALERGIDGTVHISFIIDESGNIANVKVVKSVDKSLDAEAIRVLSEAPKWKPGKQRGKPVKVSMSLPVKFALQ